MISGDEVLLFAHRRWIALKLIQWGVLLAVCLALDCALVLYTAKALS